jgi:predicted small metal-binding protein
MKHFSCGDVVPNCRARFEGATEAEILAKIAKHASEDHGMTSIPDDMLQTVRSHITDWNG